MNDSKHFRKKIFLDHSKISKTESRLKKYFFRFQIFPGPEIFTKNRLPSKLSKKNCLNKIYREKIYQKINGMVKNTVFQNLDLKKIGSRFFLDLKKLWGVPSIIFYHFWSFEENLYVRTYLKKLLSVKTHIRNYWMIQIFFG